MQQDASKSIFISTNTLNKGSGHCFSWKCYQVTPVWGAYVFSSFLSLLQSQWLLLLMSKPLELHLRYLGQRKYRSGRMYLMTLLWPWPKVTTVALINKSFLVCRIKWEPLNQSLQKLSSDIRLVMSIIWWDFGWILLETFCLSNFLWIFRMGFFKVKRSIGHISEMVSLIDVKQKGGTSLGYWVYYMTLTFDLTHDLDLWFFKVKFQNSSGIVIWLLWNKKKANLLFSLG